MAAFKGLQVWNVTEVRHRCMIVHWKMSAFYTWFRHLLFGVHHTFSWGAKTKTWPCLAWATPVFVVNHCFEAWVLVGIGIGTVHRNCILLFFMLPWAPLSKGWSKTFWTPRQNAKCRPPNPTEGGPKDECRGTEMGTLYQPADCFSWSMNWLVLLDPELDFCRHCMPLAVKKIQKLIMTLILLWHTQAK